MSQIIDERIVEMRFDNKQFESGVKESLNTLDKLKESLNLEDSAKSFEKIDKAANSISLEGISAGIEALQKRFSTLGIVGMRVIENITDSLMGMASSAMSYVSDAIISGGLKRAQNIENAHFQLQALLKDEIAVQAVMDNAMASVDGTAYAYDEAAKAASQFAASGMRAGEEMESALRAITGVAAMTNSEYEGISRIFTTVAGNGRLMGDQLLQLSSRGLNAAATIADYFREVQGQADMTESKIREMVSDGEISFQTFAAAMDWAFGESAFRANETFTGALSNMRSALARIGAEFFSPLIEQNSDLILLINTLRERINDVKKAVTFDEQRSAISGLTKATGYQTETLEKMFDTIKEQGSVSTDQLNTLARSGVNAAQSLTDYINGVNNGTIRTTYATKTAISELTGGLEVSEAQVRQFVEDGKIDLKMFTSAMETAYGDQKALSKQFTDSVLNMAKGVSEYLQNLDLTKPMATLYNGVEATKNVFSGLYSVLKPLGRALVETFGFSMDDVLSLSEKIESLTSKMKLSEKGSQDLHDAFKGILDIAKLLGDGFISLLNAILPVEKPVTSLGSGLLSLAGAAGRVLSEFAEWVRSSPNVSKAYDMISEGIETASSWVLYFIDNLDDFIDTVKNFPFVSSMIDVVTNAFETMKGALDKVEIRFIPFKNVLDVFMSVIKTAGPIAVSIIRGIGHAISFLLESVSKAVGEGGFNSFIDLLNSGLLVGIGVGLSKFIESLTATVNKAGGLFSNINRNLMLLKNTLLAFQAQLKANVLKTIAVSIAILAGSLFVLSMIDSEKLGASLGVVTVLMGELFATLAAFDKIMKGSQVSMSKISTGLMGLSVSVLILASALKKISGIDSDKLLGSLGVITALLVEMTGVAIVLSKYGGKIQTGAVGIIAFSAAIYILASAVKKLGDFDADVLIKGLVSVAALLAELSLFMMAAEFGGFKTSQAIAIIGLSAALLILQKAVEGFGNIDTEVLIKGIVAVAGVLAEISLFTLAAGESKHILSTATSLVIIASALLILAKPMEQFGNMSWEQIGKGLVAMGGALAELTLALRLMPKNMISIGLGILEVAAALIVIANAVSNMASMSWEEIGKGMVVLAGSMAILVVSLNLMKGTLGASAAMLVMAGALAVFVPVLKSLGGMAWSEIAKGLVTLGAAFVVVGVAGKLLGPLVPSILSLSAAMLMLGVACAAVGVGVLAFSVGLTTLAASGVATVAALVEVIRILIIGILDAIADSAASLAAAVKTIILVCCDVIIECVPEIVKTVLVVIKEVLIALADNGPTIVHELLRFIVGIIDALAADLPTVIQSVVNLFMQFFAGVIDALQGIDTTVLLEGIAGIGLIAAIMLALAALASLAPEAMIGVLAMGAVIAELALVLAAVGALAQIPGLKWLIGEGGDLLQGVGTAIGKFVGGIVGGFMTGVSAQFPQIGTDLSNFMTNVQPFIEGAKQIDASAMDGVMSLAKVILLLTAADILEGLTSWFTGGSSIVEFGAELAEFGPHFASYYESIKGVDGTVVQASANAALALAEMASKLPNQGGVVGWFAGENSLAVFAEELTEFGPKLKEYADSVKGLDADVVIASANAALALAEMADKLPNQGGVVGWFAGENSLSVFAEELASFGPVLKQYADSVRGLDSDVVIASTNAAMAMAEMANNLPNQGGMVSWFTGDNTLSVFGEEISKFGPYIAQYAKDVAGLDPSVVVASANAAKALSELASNLPNTGGLVSWFTGDNDIADFGKSLAKFGASMTEYYNSVSGIDTFLLDNVVQEVKKLIDIANGTASIDTSGMTGFADALKKMGNNGIDGFIQAFNDSTSKVNTAVQGLITTANNAVTNSGSNLNQTAQTTGKNVPDGLATGIESNVGSVNTAVTSLATTITSTMQTNLTSSTFNTLGQNVVTYLINGINTKKPLALTTVKNLCTAIISQFKVSLDSKTFSTMGENIVQALINGINTKRPLALTTVKNLCDAIISQFKTSLPNTTFSSIGEGIVQALANGISSKKGTAEQAAKDVSNAVISAFKNTMSISTFNQIGANAGQGLADGITSKTSAIKNAATKAASEAISAAKSALDEHSPSKIMAKIGEFASLGLAKGILAKIFAIGNASEEAAEVSVDVMNGMVQAIADVLEDNPDFQPTIRPVLDLSGVRDGFNQITQMFNERFKLATYERAMAASESFGGRTNILDQTRRAEDGTPKSNTYQFIQNNYSPKPLSRVEIYRQSKNLFSTWKGAVEGV